MPLDAGQKLSHYRLVEKIGEGGMGVVWKAVDTTLDREVAIKFVSEAFAGDSERRHRFEREARLLASLKHPNIAAVYGLHEADGERFLAMELVEGEGLGTRTALGPLAPEDALEFARQIAEALEAAHERGVVHRDLKPANIMIDFDGRIKVLDFGLAKTLVTGGPEAEDETTRTQLTREGIVHGTLAYMSPEQAQGRTVDRRGDIWAFGCVLYEMLAGRPAFRGESPTDTLAAVLRSEPDLSLLPEHTPASTSRLVRRCLQKDPRRRLQAIGEARIVIEEHQADSTSERLPSTAPVEPGRPWLPWALFGMTALLALLSAGLYWSSRSEMIRSPAPTGPARFELETPYLWWDADENAIALSPSGDAVTYVSLPRPGEPPMLWVRDLDDVDTRRIAGTEGAVNPFWSPDGRGVGYVQGDAVKVVDRAGGPSRVLVDVGQTFGPPSQAPDGTLLLSLVPVGERLVRVSLEDGEPVPVTPTVGEGYLGHVFPHWLPDGRRFLFVALSSDADRPPQLYLSSLEGGESRLVRGVHSRAEYAAGKLFYWEDGAVVARPFDPVRGTFIGDPTPVCRTPGAHYARTGMAAFAVARQGTVVACGRRERSVELRWFDRSGEDLGSLGESGVFDNPRISPAGDRLAVESNDPRTGTSDIWVFDLERGVATRLVGGPADDDSPAWSPDGERLAYSSDATGPPRPFIRRADGAGSSTLVRTDEGLPSYVTDWSGDGSSILYRAFAEDSNLHIATVDGDEPSRLFAGGPGHQFDARFSPDGRWIAFASTELGTMEVFVAPRTDPAALQRVSPAGGTLPAWSLDSDEIYYANGDTLYAASFSSRDGTIGTPRELFSLGSPLDIHDFDLTPEGDRLLIAVNDLDRSRSSVTIVVNPAP